MEHILYAQLNISQLKSVEAPYANTILTINFSYLNDIRRV